ncbi:hypothetical protein [cf. Phormidesmis sp. LEGE 11477]|nr:hypothetical protein [cf. Phormidesmis sp. LEGE 11477]
MNINLGLCAITAIVTLGLTALLIGGSISVGFRDASVRVESASE